MSEHTADKVFSVVFIILVCLAAFGIASCAHQPTPACDNPVWGMTSCRVARHQDSCDFATCDKDVCLVLDLSGPWVCDMQFDSAVDPGDLPEVRTLPKGCMIIPVVGGVRVMRFDPLTCYEADQ